MTTPTDGIRPTDIAPPRPHPTESDEQLCMRLERTQMQRNRIAWLIRRGALDGILDQVDEYIERSR